MTVPYIFANATTSLPLSELDVNFATPITLGNTAVILGNTYATLVGVNLTGGNLVSSNVIITGGSITNVAISNATYVGLGTMSTQNANSVTITGGTINSVAHTGGSINNMTIGATTANTGAFTTLSASANFTASTNVITTQYTGYLYGNNNTALTASTTIPNTAITGLGTMATQDANNVTITGGSVSANISGNGLGLTNLNASNVSSGTLAVAYGGTGVANLTAGYAVLGNNTSQVVLLAPGTSGNVLTSNGTAWISNASSGGGGGSTGIGNSSILALNVNITANATINAGVNGFSVGPITTANGVSVTIASGQRWVVL